MAAIGLSPFTLFRRFRRIATVLLWVSLLASVNGQKRTSDVQTLLEFKSQMSVDSNALSIGYWSTWKDTDSNPCGWWGVTCTNHSTAEQLNLSNWGLTVPPNFTVLSNLPDLRSLDLSLNSFRQSNGLGGPNIPDDVGSLTGIARLVMQGSRFGGQIPTSITACTNLKYLDLTHNVLIGEIPDLSNFVNLQYLYLTTNELNGSFPTGLERLNSLLAVDLSNNFLYGHIPSLSGLTNIREVLLANNSFTSFQEPIFPGATNLKQLSVRLNQLSGEIPASITQLRGLRSLDMSVNNFSGPIPSNFSLDMSDGAMLDLSGNQLTGTIPPNLLQSTAYATSLPILRLANNNLTGHIPFDPSKGYNYQSLDFSNNNLNGSLPSICRNGATFISQFSVSNNSLSGDILPFLVECYDHILHMILANNSLTGDLSSHPYANASIDSTFGAARLQGGSLDLSNNNLHMTSTEANPDPLRAFLEVFVFNASLVEFHIAGINFSETPLPAFFSIPASALQILDLSNNHLKGEISTAAFNSTWFPAIQRLDFSNNDITGPIPEAILTLPKLAVLNVINNSLSGPLPPVPASLNSAFFAGNDGLCGAPLGACSHRQGLRSLWWILFIIICVAVVIVVGSCLAVFWRWRVYHKIHRRDSDLIKTLLEKESASVMTLRELKRATNNFAESAQIGEGGFGIVYAGKLSDGTEVAVKRSKCDGSEKVKNRFLNEVRILSQLNHRHLVKLLGCCMESGIALLVFEFVSNGTLLQHLQGKSGPERLSWDQRVKIAAQTANSINYLHSAATFPIYHRDVKSANILLDGDLNAKVSDFGISKLVSLDATHASTIAIQGTIGYIDPEYYTSYKLNAKSDVYSFGVVLLELISAKPPIDFLRGGENTGLVSFAKPYIESGDLRPLLDSALVETYNDLAGYGRQSILRVGRLAMKCLLMQSQDRPSMHNVWKELQNIWYELPGTIISSDTMDDDVSQSSFHDHIILLSDSDRFSDYFSTKQDASTGIQMATSLDTGLRVPSRVRSHPRRSGMSN